MTEASDSGERTCVYRFLDEGHRPLYVGMTADPQSRWKTHKRTEWWPRVAVREVEWFPTRTEASEVERRLIKEMEPEANRERYDGRPPGGERKTNGTATEAGINVHLEELLRERNMSQAALARQVDIHVVNLSRLRNGHVSFIRLDTLAALCRELECQPGDLLTYE